LVFGCQQIDYNTTFSCDNINDAIENACTKFNLTKSIIINSNKIFYKLINKKLKSSYSHKFYKTFSILKACENEKVVIDPQLLGELFSLSDHKFFKFKKYLSNSNIDYLHPSSITQECNKILNILNVKNSDER